MQIIPVFSIPVLPTKVQKYTIYCLALSVSDTESNIGPVVD